MLLFRTNTHLVLARRGRAFTKVALERHVQNEYPQIVRPFTDAIKAGKGTPLNTRVDHLFVQPVFITSLHLQPVFVTNLHLETGQPSWSRSSQNDNLKSSMKLSTLDLLGDVNSRVKFFRIVTH